MKSVRSSLFKQQFERLPENVQRTATRLFELFQADPQHPSLSQKPLHDSAKGKHRAESISLRINVRYRAIYVIDHGPHGDEEHQAFWYWIGSHQDYNAFVGTK